MSFFFLLGYFIVVLYIDFVEQLINPFLIFCLFSSTQQ